MHPYSACGLGDKSTPRERLVDALDAVVVDASEIARGELLDLETHVEEGRCSVNVLALAQELVRLLYSLQISAVEADRHTHPQVLR